MIYRNSAMVIWLYGLMGFRSKTQIGRVAGMLPGKRAKNSVFSRKKYVHPCEEKVSYDSENVA